MIIILIIIIFPLTWLRQPRNLTSIQYVQQQSATQSSSDMAHTLSGRTATTTRFSTEGGGCQKQTEPRFANNPIRPGLYLASIHQMAPLKQGSTHLIITLLLICRLRKDERLSWPSWLTCSERFTHISGHPSAAVKRRTGKLRRRSTDVPPLCYVVNLFSMFNDDGEVRWLYSGRLSDATQYERLLAPSWRRQSSGRLQLVHRQVVPRL